LEVTKDGAEHHADSQNPNQVISRFIMPVFGDLSMWQPHNLPY